MNDFLRKVPLFSSLSDDDLDRLCEIVTQVHLPAGEMLFSEGEMGDKAYVIKEGQIEIVKSSGGRTVRLAVRQPGDVIGEMSLLEAAPRMASGIARTDSELLAISHRQLDHLLNTSPSAARAMLFTISARYRSTELLLRQSEKMAQLGTLTAGIAHEINNPSAAVVRGSQQLRDEISNLQNAQIKIGELKLSPTSFEVVRDLDDLAKQRAAKPIELDSITRSDREYEIENWLDERDVENVWESSPLLVTIGFQTPDLENLLNNFTPSQLPAIIKWLGTTFSIYNLLEEINQGSGRISDIVKALKHYVYLDQAPVQLVDIHEGLNNTLIILRSKLKKGVTIQREFSDDLPLVEAYGSELNQVWTNLIDNAIDAVDGNGVIILRTQFQDPWLKVEVEDNGAGIPLEVQSKLFSPFFTTKPVGKGTGLGLNISYNIIAKHGGEIKFFSQKGKTCFEVWLPKKMNNGNSTSSPPIAFQNPDDAKLLQILNNYHTIAVVGMTDYQDRPSYSVPAYLQNHGYEIIPVNPHIEEVLDKKTCPDLLAISKPIDVVLVFRRSEAVPEIVDQAIKVGAKVIWMQEGIVNEAAAQIAKAAGLDVVMDICMRATYKRLIRPQ